MRENHTFPSAQIKPLTHPLFTKKTHHIQKVTTFTGLGSRASLQKYQLSAGQAPPVGGEGDLTRHRDGH